MISGAKTGLETLAVRALHWLAGALLALMLLPAASAAAFELPALMALLAAQRSGEASFTEQRHVRGLDMPLVSSGLLQFEAPDRFVRRTLKPRAETMAVEGNRVTVTSSGRSRTFSLDAAPELVGLVEAIRATLTGNEAVLRRHFKPELSGGAAGWMLVLTPLEPRLAAQLRQIRIGGRRGQLERIEMDMTDGDYSAMKVTPLAAGRPAAPAPTASNP